MVYWKLLRFLGFQVSCANVYYHVIKNVFGIKSDGYADVFYYFYALKK